MAISELKCWLLVLVAAASVPASPLRAEDGDGAQAADKSGYSLVNPVPDNALRSFNPDRPAKSTGPYTVDAGRVQLESDFATYTFQKVDGVRTVSVLAPNPNLKIGVTSFLDVQVNLAPFMWLGTEDKGAGTTSHRSGQSDLYLRSKFNLWGNDGGKSAFAFIPWVKVPTAASGLGNGATEGGVIAALQVSLPGDASLLLNSEVDWLKDSSGDGYHGNYINAVGVTVPVVEGLSLTTELWSQLTDDPAGTTTQLSFDAALAWQVRPNLQLDAGANVGLTHDTPQLQLYTGVSYRF